MALDARAGSAEYIPMSGRSGDPARARGTRCGYDRGVNLSRRALLRGAGGIISSWLVASPRDAWGAPAPRSVRDHGARGDGKANDTGAIQRAIDAAGPGGVVLFPPGNYVSGTLHLRDHLVLRLAAGATLIASPDDADFDPPRNSRTNRSPTARPRTSSSPCSRAAACATSASSGRAGSMETGAHAAAPSRSPSRNAATSRSAT